MQMFSSGLTLNICSEHHTCCFCCYVIIAFVVDGAVLLRFPECVAFALPFIRLSVMLLHPELLLPPG